MSMTQICVSYVRLQHRINYTAFYPIATVAYVIGCKGLHYPRSVHNIVIVVERLSPSTSVASVNGVA